MSRLGRRRAKTQVFENREGMQGCNPCGGAVPPHPHPRQ
jgi:hypothetical protein